MIHLMDGEQRIALLRVGAPFSGDESQDPALQYILGDHLGNSSMTANTAGALVHREEFTPYGETSFGGYGEQRYRFTGKERDEESGLSYHRARYYAGWLGRWVSADPAGMVDGVNVFQYSMNSPILFVDVSGTDSINSNKQSSVECQVGVDCNGFVPINLEGLAAILPYEDMHCMPEIEESTCYEDSSNSDTCSMSPNDPFYTETTSLPKDKGFVIGDIRGKQPITTERVSLRAIENFLIDTGTNFPVGDTERWTELEKLTIYHGFSVDSLFIASNDETDNFEKDEYNLRSVPIEINQESALAQFSGVLGRELSPFEVGLLSKGDSKTKIISIVTREVSDPEINFFWYPRKRVISGYLVEISSGGYPSNFRFYNDRGKLIGEETLYSPGNGAATGQRNLSLLINLFPPLKPLNILKRIL